MLLAPASLPAGSDLAQNNELLLGLGPCLCSFVEQACLLPSADPLCRPDSCACPGLVDGGRVLDWLLVSAGSCATTNLHFTMIESDDACGTRLRELCGGGGSGCEVCCGQNQHVLRAAGCTAVRCADFCAEA